MALLKLYLFLQAITETAQHGSRASHAVLARETGHSGKMVRKELPRFPTRKALFIGPRADFYGFQAIEIDQIELAFICAGGVVDKMQTIGSP